MLKKTKPVIDEQLVKTMLEDAIQTIKTEEDPLILNEYRRIFKKTVLFPLLWSAPAFFIKEFEQSPPPSNPFNRRSGRYQERARIAAAEHPVLTPSESTSIFINIGRNRRVFPRDIISLLIQNTDIPREHIGTIRILENYSFVQIIAADADQVIEKLNNFSYRGRTLSISYSRKEASEDVSVDQIAEAAVDVQQA